MPRFEVIEGGQPPTPIPLLKGVVDFPLREVTPLTVEQFHRIWPTEELERAEVQMAELSRLDEARQQNLHIVRQEGDI